MKTIGGEIINEATITVAGEWEYGMSAIDSGTITNENIIEINAINGVATGINDDLGIINLNANDGIGIKVDISILMRGIRIMFFP